MLFSMSNAVLLAALALNVASTLGAPIPRRENYNINYRALQDGSDASTRFLDILVPKKRFRQWNKTRRAARESALKAIRRAEARLALLAEVEESLGHKDPLPYSASDIWERDLAEDEEERRGVAGSHHIGRRSDDDGDVDAAAKELGKMFEKVLSDMHMCPCVSQCPTDPGTPQPCGPGAAPCPGQPGSGDPGTGNSGETGMPPNSTDTDLPVTQTDVPPMTGTDSQPLQTDSATVMPTGVPDGGNDNNSTVSDAIPSPTDSATDPAVTGTSDPGNSTSSGTGGGDPTDTSTDPSATGTSDSDDGVTDGGEGDGDSGDSNTGDTRRTLFERWLEGRTLPVRRAPAGRVNSARFRLT